LISNLVQRIDDPLNTSLPEYIDLKSICDF